MALPFYYKIQVQTIIDINPFFCKFNYLNELNTKKKRLNAKIIIIMIAMKKEKKRENDDKSYSKAMIKFTFVFLLAPNIK